MVRNPSDRGSGARPGEAERAGWMAAAQRGDAEAYASLLRSLLAPLRAFVRSRGVDAGEIEDVVQEILISIHRARHTWRADRPFEPWLWAVARNASTDALRWQGRERSRRGRPAHVPGREPPAGDALATSGAALDPEAQLTARELSPGLVEALRKLPASQREAVELLYVEQLTVAEAASRAGVSASALKVRAHRGARALRDALRAEDEA